MPRIKQPRTTENEKLRSRRWVMTLYNYTLTTMDHLLKLVVVGKAKYCGLGMEVGKKSGKPHIHGIFWFDVPKRLSWMKKHVHPTAWFCVMYGTWNQAKSYACKGGNYIDKGVEPHQGDRTDIRDFAMACFDLDTPEVDVFEQYPVQYVKYGNGFPRVRKLALRKKELEIIARPDVNSFRQVIVYWGPTGTGKTHRVKALHGAGNFYHWNDNGGSQGSCWFESYHDEDVMLIDDLDTMETSLKLTFLLNILNKETETVVQCKFGSYNIPWKTIYITSNDDPANWYPRSRYAVHNQLMRRLDVIENLTEVYVPPTSTYIHFFWRRRLSNSPVRC